MENRSGPLAVGESSAFPNVIDDAWTRHQLSHNLHRVLNPAVCYQALEALRKPDGDFGDIAATLQGDPFVAAKVVGLANLMRRAGDPTIETMERAVAVLGVRYVRSLVLAVMLTGPLVAAPGFVPHRRDLWRWVFGCAAAGDCLGAALDSPSGGAKPAKDQQHLVQGLMLGLGALILQAGLGRAYDRTLGVTLRPLQLAARERRMLHVTHHHVTVWALRSLRCPTKLIAPAEALMADRRDDVGLRARAIEVLGARGVGLDTGRAEAWLADALPRLGLTAEDFLDEAVPMIRSRVRELTRVFSTDLGDWTQQVESRQEVLMLAGESIQELLEERAGEGAATIRASLPARTA